MLAGGPVTWTARRQSVVALSTAEAAYPASCEACQEGKAMMNILFEEHGVEFKLCVDNQAAVSIAARPTYSRKIRYIELRYHYVRDTVSMKIVKMWKVDGDLKEEFKVGHLQVWPHRDLETDMRDQTKNTNKGVVVFICC
ncbi:hypothetical protein PC110_g21715 [Phytophthora cactorum]|nr:hypothetical protein PC110_g21715 [Phytophthora cactorum]